MEARDVFPAMAGFPDAVTDVACVPKDVTSLRLVSKALNLALLLELSRLERLWCFDLNVESASMVGRLDTLRRLYVDGCRLAGLGALAGLTRLEVLSVERGTRITSLEELAPFRGVRALGVLHFPKVRSLTPLTQFDSLRALAVAGGMWARLTVESLAPLSSLRSLQYLHLTNLKARDGSLEPLASLTGLKTLELPNFYSIEEFARLSAHLRTTRCTWFSSFVPMPSSTCDRCGRASMVMLTGKGMPTLCLWCDELRVRRHDEHFKSLAASAGR